MKAANLRLHVIGGIGGGRRVARPRRGRRRRQVADRPARRRFGCRRRWAERRQRAARRNRRIRRGQRRERHRPAPADRALPQARAAAPWAAWATVRPRHRAACTAAAASGRARRGRTGRRDLRQARGANGGAVTPAAGLPAAAGGGELPPSASGPPGLAAVAPDRSVFASPGHPSATPGGWAGSTLFRDSETYTPYPTAPNTAMIIRFFTEFMSVLLDESRIEVHSGDKRADDTKKGKTMLWQVEGVGQQTHGFPISQPPGRSSTREEWRELGNTSASARQGVSGECGHRRHSAVTSSWSAKCRISDFTTQLPPVSSMYVRSRDCTLSLGPISSGQLPVASFRLPHDRVPHACRVDQAAAILYTRHKRISAPNNGSFPPCRMPNIRLL